jgi:hypothetical protein
VASFEIDLWRGESMWPEANAAFGMAEPEKTIHYGGGFTEDGETQVFRNRKEPVSGARWEAWLKQFAEGVRGERKTSRAENIEAARRYEE